MSGEAYYANWELVDYRVMYETRKRTLGSRGAINIIVHSWRQVRPVLIKTYEATLQDVNPSVPELPCPTYLAGSNIMTPNPENLSPIGWEQGQWHMADVQYNKDLTSPLSRKIRVIWEKYGAWQTIEDDDSDSQ